MSTGKVYPASRQERDQRRGRLGEQGQRDVYQGNASLATPSHVLSHHGAATDGGDGKCRDECLNEHWFLSVADAKAVIEAWRVDYNGVRPHSSLNGATPDGAGQRGQRFGATAE